MFSEIDSWKWWIYFQISWKGGVINFKIDKKDRHTCAEHSSNVSVSLIETLLDDRVDKRRSVEQHPFVALVVVLFSYFTPAVRIPVDKMCFLQ